MDANCLETQIPCCLNKFNKLSKLWKTFFLAKITLKKKGRKKQNVEKLMPFSVGKKQCVVYY